MIAALCDKNGDTQCGSDGYVHVDGRLTLENQVEAARQYRERFRLHFRHKYDTWTHVMIAPDIRSLPGPHHRSTPRIHSLGEVQL